MYGLNKMYGLIDSGIKEAVITVREHTYPDCIACHWDTGTVADPVVRTDGTPGETVLLVNALSIP